MKKEKWNLRVWLTGIEGLVVFIIVEYVANYLMGVILSYKIFATIFNFFSAWMFAIPALLASGIAYGAAYFAAYGSMKVLVKGDCSNAAFISGIPIIALALIIFGVNITTGEFDLTVVLISCGLRVVCGAFLIAERNKLCSPIVQDKQ